METPPALPEEPLEPSVLEEEFSISPEHLEFAKCYLSCLDLKETAKLMRLDLEDVTAMYKHKDVRTVIDQAFLDQGYMNKHAISSAMTSVIEAKLAEMQETELVSTKDISELLLGAHKMRMEEMRLQLKMLEIEKLGKPKVNTAVQINNMGGTSNYGNLLEKIVSGSS